MIPLRIEGADIVLRGGRDGVRDLFARRVDNCIVTRWEPTPEELQELNNGGSVELWVWGTHAHPPIMLQTAKQTGEPTDD